MSSAIVRFVSFELRTTRVAEAQVFYDVLLGPHRARVVPLPAAAAQRGAPTHWLGYLGVGEVAATLSAVVARGATQLGPLHRTPDGVASAIVRDEGGAIVGLTSPPESPGEAGVVWHHLYARDASRSSVTYRDVLGFAPDAVTDVADLRGVHPHWLFGFRVPALAPAVAWLEAQGGRVIGRGTLPDGRELVACEDPQGAALALVEQPPPA